MLSPVSDPFGTPKTGPKARGLAEETTRTWLGGSKLWVCPLHGAEAKRVGHGAEALPRLQRLKGRKPTVTQRPPIAIKTTG